MPTSTHIEPAAQRSFDVAVIGAGPGGYLAALHCARLGLNVALIERDSLGGVLLNWGCIPTKVLAKVAELADVFRHGSHLGLTATGLHLDYAAAHRHSRDVAERMKSDVQTQLSALKVQFFSAEATLLDSTHVTLQLAEGQEVLHAGHIVLATGVSPAPLPFGTDGEHVMTSLQALERPVLPETLAVVGSGAIGVELAYVFGAFNSATTLLERGPHILPDEDSEIASAMSSALVQSGIRIHAHREVILATIRARPGGKKVVELTVRDSRYGGERIIEIDAVVLATGQVPNTTKLGLERAGVMCDERGYIAIRSDLRTNIPNILAVGDVTGNPALASVASLQARAAAHAIGSDHGRPMGARPDTYYHNVPHYIYAQPQVARVGLTQLQAEVRGYDVISRKMPFKTSLGMTDGPIGVFGMDGLLKTVSDRTTNELLGVHLMGPRAAEVLQRTAFAQLAKMRESDVLGALREQVSIREPFLGALRDLEGLAM